jgi:hypothetical protein
VDNIKIDLREVGWGGMDWIDLVQDRDQYSCEYDNEPSGFVKFWEILE